jgi:hypothetical protein
MHVGVLEKRKKRCAGTTSREDRVSFGRQALGQVAHGKGMAGQFTNGGKEEDVHGLGSKQNI